MVAPISYFLCRRKPSLQFSAEAVVPGFKALFDFDAQLGEFEGFRDQIRAMYDALKGTIHFENLESNVIVDATIRRHLYSDEGPPISQVTAEPWREAASEIGGWVLKWSKVT